jgi:hypothetical protein
MANVLSQVNIVDGQIVEAHHISQSINAFTGVEAYDISLSGSFNMTGSINGEPLRINPLTSSYAINALYAADAIAAFPYYGNATISGSLGVTGESLFEGPIAGLFNTAIESFALGSIVSGNYNIAIGNSALLNNLTGADNIAIGESSLSNNTIGADNIAIGYNTLPSNTIENGNIAIGENVGNNVTSINIAIGSEIDFDNFFNSFALGHNITVGTDNELHIGSATDPVGTFISASIGAPPTAWQVYINETLVNFELY